MIVFKGIQFDVAYLVPIAITIVCVTGTDFPPHISTMFIQQAQGSVIPGPISLLPLVAVAIFDLEVR